MSILEKKLICAVLHDWDIIHVVGVEDGFLVVNGSRPNTMSFTGQDAINIYELAWKTKKWAFDLGYVVDTKMTYSELKTREYGSKVLDACHNVDWETGLPYNPICDIKVCEWIIENDERFSSET